MNSSGGPHTKSNLKVHVGVHSEVPEAGADAGPRASGARPDAEIISGKVARDYVHVFLSYRPTQQVSQIMQWLKGISSRVLLQEFPRLRKQSWGRHVWARGYLAVSGGTITEEMI